MRPPNGGDVRSARRCCARAATTLRSRPRPAGVACGLVGRKPTDSQVSKLLASSNSLLVLASEAVQQACLPVARELEERCKAAIAEADRAAAATPHHHAVCTEAASAGYVEAAMGELLLVQSLAAVLQRLQQAWPSGKRDEAYRGRLPLLAKELKKALDERREQAVERVIVLLAPRRPGSPTPRSSRRACRSRATRAPALGGAPARGLQGAAAAAARALQARVEKHEPYRAPAYPSHVCASCSGCAAGGCARDGPQPEADGRANLHDQAPAAGKFVPNHRFGKSIGHVGKCLWFGNHFAHKGDLLQAPSRTDDQPLRPTPIQPAH